MISSLYVHIPYCKSICTYCDFCKMFYQEEQANCYLEELNKELMTVYQGEELKTIYIGGGTPSCLNINQLKKLFKILDQTKKSKDLEFTIECNFDSIDSIKLDLLKEAGINRLSFGLETVQKRQEEYLGRDNNQDHIRSIIAYAKQVGLTNINIDLMYALKEETIEELEKDISFILSLDVPHISTYSLMIEEHTLLKLQGNEPIDSDLDAKMYEFICRKLQEYGYKHYEISNFAKDPFFSSHNLTYWKNMSYYGIGLGAASYYNNKRISNTRSITKYLQGDYVLEVENLTEKETMEYEIILRLRLKEGISKEQFFKKFHKKLEDVFCYQELLKNHLLQQEGDYVKIPEDKFYISNYIIEEFIYGKE